MAQILIDSLMNLIMEHTLVTSHWRIRNDRKANLDKKLFYAINWYDLEMSNFVKALVPT